MIAILLYTAVSAQDKNPFLTEVDTFKSAQTNMILTVKNKRVYIGDSAVSNGIFAWNDNVFILTNFKSRYTWNNDRQKKIIKRLHEKSTTWLKIGNRHYKFYKKED